MSDDNKFVAVRPEDTRAILQAGVPTSAKLSIWTEQQKHTLNARILRVTHQDQLVYIAVPKDADGLRFETALRVSGIEACLFSLHLPTDVLFFRGELKRSDPSAMNFRVTEPVYKVQRRRSLRLPAPASDAIEVSLHLSSTPDTKISTQLLNVSEGGVSLALSDEALFRACREGTHLREIDFTMNGLRIQASGVVRHTQELPGKVKNKYRLGVQFTQLDPALQERISRFVIEESSKFFGRI